MVSLSTDFTDSRRFPERYFFNHGLEAKRKDNFSEKNRRSRFITETTETRTVFFYPLKLAKRTLNFEGLLTGLQDLSFDISIVPFEIF